MWKWMTMSTLCSVIYTSLAGGQATVPSAVRSPRQVLDAVVAEGRLSFDGRANVGDFTGTTTTVSGQLTGGDDITQVRGWVEAPVRTLVTGNGKRDKDLNKSMESDKYPTIRFELTQAVAQGALADSMDVVLRGQFLIHGVTKEVELPATLVFLSDGVRVRSTTPLNLKDYEIGGLSKFLGVLKMSEKIEVHVDVTFGYQ